MVCVCVLMVFSVNSRDEDENVSTPRSVQHKSVSQSNATSSHEERHSVHAGSSSRPSSGRSRQPASVEVSSVEVGSAGSPAAAQSVLSYIETPRDAVMTARWNNIQHETVNDKGFTRHSVTSTSCKPSSDPADTSGPASVSVPSHNSNIQSSVKTAASQESLRSAANSRQSGNHDKPKAPRLAICIASSLLAIFVAD